MYYEVYDRESEWWSIDAESIYFMVVTLQSKISKLENQRSITYYIVIRWKRGYRFAQSDVPFRLRVPVGSLSSCPVL
jgi:hypothetical protein